MINIPKGTKDVLPSESYKWHFVEEKLKEVAGLFGLKEIRTPTFEHTELFLRGVGDTTDVVNKEMYTFNDKAGRSITLKCEGTAGVARSFIENGLFNNALPQKMYYETPVFRYERPQAGRLREHHQFGVEYYGAKGAEADAEVILIAYSILKKLGLNVKLNINSIGCPECRKKYNDALKVYLNSKIDKMCPVCKDRLERNPLRILDCKEEECKKICKGAPVILDYLCDDCKAHFEKLQAYLRVSDLEYAINPMIVRGLDYYTRTVFEFVTTDLGSQGTVCGGGRYDSLVSQIGGPQVPCVGFGMGIERVLMLMESKGVFFPDNSATKLYIASMGEECAEFAFALCSKIRASGVSCECDLMQRGIKAQFKYADKIKAENVVVIGSGELEKGAVSVKRMCDGRTIDCTLSADSIIGVLNN